MTYLILGAAGQDGTLAAFQLRERGENVWAGVRVLPPKNHPLYAFLPRTRVLRVDVESRESIQSAILRSKPSRLLNFAGFSSVSQSWSSPNRALEINVLGAANVLQSIISLNLVNQIRIYQASSSEIFGRPTLEPQDERQEMRPVTPYGASKAAAHQLVEMYREQYGMWAASGILFNHESPLRSEEYVVRHVTASAARIAVGEQTTLRIGDMTARRDWGFAPDYVSGMIRILEHSEATDFVLATGVAKSVRNLVEVAFEAARVEDWESRTEIDETRFRRTEPVNLVGDFGRAQRLLGWSPTLPFSEMIELFVEIELWRLGPREQCGAQHSLEVLRRIHSFLP